MNEKIIRNSIDVEDSKNWKYQSNSKNRNKRKINNYIRISSSLRIFISIRVSKSMVLVEFNEENLWKSSGLLLTPHNSRFFGSFKMVILTKWQAWWSRKFSPRQFIYMNFEYTWIFPQFWLKCICIFRFCSIIANYPTWKL